MKYDSDDFLVSMLCETNEDVRNTLYEKYKYLIDYQVKRYLPMGQKIGLEYNDIVQEANVAFTNAINHYDISREAGLPTFINLCIERQLNKIIRDHTTVKEKINYDVLSLDYIYSGDSPYTLQETLKDENSDLEQRFERQEWIKHIIDSVDQVLSLFEKEVFMYMLNGLNYQEISKILDKTPKQIDNTMQRIRLKARAIIDKEKEV